jgi:transcriptional regulator with XRE-family HTH domain
MDYKILGNNIREVRKRAHITQEKLAEYIDVSAVFISQIENGMRKPSLETVYKLSLILKTPIDKFLENVIYIDDEKDFDELTILLSNRNNKEKRFIIEIVKNMLDNLKDGQIK